MHLPKACSEHESDAEQEGRKTFGVEAKVRVGQCVTEGEYRVGGVREESEAVSGT